MRNWPLFVAAPLAAFASASQATVYLSVEQAQQAIFPNASFTPAHLTFTSEQRRAIESKSGVNVRSRDQKIWQVSGGGWFILDEVVGKHEFITYAVGLNAGGDVRQIEIMEYRESYGHEIRKADWRRQFAGKTVADPLKLDRDIRNISGATLSCRHITDGVKRLLALYEVVLK
jgi:hypothetical protein